MALFLDLDNAIAVAADKGFVDALAREDDLALMLQSSAAITSSGVKSYRPHYVAAKVIEQSFEYQSLTEADGAKFTGLVRTIASLLGWQTSEDAANAALADPAIVPPSFSADAAIDAATGVKSKVFSFMVV